MLKWHVNKNNSFLIYQKSFDLSVILRDPSLRQFRMSKVYKMDFYLAIILALFLQTSIRLQVVLFWHLSLYMKQI